MRKRLLGKIVAVLVVVAFGAAATGCYGKFNLTRKIYEANSQVQEKWLRSCVTALLIVIPVYGIAALLDWIVFNTIEFWSGKNPIAAGPVTKEYAFGNERAVMTIAAKDGGAVTTVERYRGETLISRLTITDDGNGRATAVEVRDGKAVREVSAGELPDGSYEVSVATPEGTERTRHGAREVASLRDRVNRVAARKGADGTAPVAAFSPLPAMQG